ncbi:Ig-like domain-containing protein [candidate division TA06 bacterium]|nr:Ig-like domain-containing protein [candidate division TA06 bacterium]
MKKLFCLTALILAVAMPARAVRYGVKSRIQPIGTGQIPTYLGYSPISDRMYSGNVGYSNVTAMSCSNDSLLGIVPGTIYSAPMVYDSVNNRIYMKSSDYFYAIDCAVNVLDTSFMISNGLNGCEFNADNNKIYVYEGMSPDMYIYDPSTYTSTGIINNVQGVAHYYSPNNSVYIPGYFLDTLNVYSGSTNARTAQVPILELSTNGGSAKMASNPALNRLYVTLPIADQVAVVNTSTNTLVATLTVGDNPSNFALCPVNNRMFAACNGSSPNSLYYIDGSDAVDSVPVGDSVSTVVYNPADSLLYIGCWRSGYVKLVDPRLPTPTVVDSVYTVYSPHFMDMKVDQGGDVYCALYNSDDIYVIGQIPRRMWRSISSGMWSSYISWNFSDNGGVTWDPNAMMLTPDCATDSLVTIDSTHLIQISGQAEYLDQVVIKAGGGLMIQTSAALGDTTGYDLDVNGMLMITAADFTQNGQIRFGPGSQYVHGVDGDTIPVADWDSTSSIDILGMMFNQPAGLNQSFGTVIWDGASQEVDMILAGEAGFSCRNLNVQGTGLARMIICSTINPIVNIPGDLTLNSGATVLMGTSGTNVVRVGGTFSVLNSGQFYLSDSMLPAVDTLILEGNYQHVWTSVHGGLPGTATMIFDGNRVHNYHGETGEMSGCVDIVVRPGSTLDVEPGYTVGSGSAGSFTLMPGATLKVRDDAGFYATGTDNGAIRVNGPRNYSKQANYYFGNGPSGYVYSGDGLPDTVNMLTIDNQDVSMPGWYQEYSSITVMDTLALLAGYVDANYPITINGPVVWGSGYISGSVPITVSGSGPDIVLPTAPGITLPTLTVDRPGRKVELPQNVNISDTLYLNNGSISNVGWGSILTVNNGATVQRTNGWVKGDLSKYIDIGTANLTYELGGDSGYTPVDMSFGSVTDPEYLTMSSLDSTAAGVDLPANCLKRHWVLNQGSMLGFSGGTATFSYLPSDFNTGLLEAANEPAMVAGGYNSSFGGWELQDIGARAAGGVSDGGTIEITGLTAVPMAKKKAADLRFTTLFTLAKDLRALQPSKMWRITGTANYWNSGFWETSSDGGATWNTPSFPDSFPTYLDSAIIIMPGADVTINMDLTLDEVVDSGTVYHTGGALTINDGPGDDMVVNGIVNRQGGTTNVNPGASLVFGPLSQYVHQMDGDAIPTASWDSLSTLSITGVMTAMPSGMDQAFGNIAWDGMQQAADMVLPGGPSFSAHDVNVTSTGPNVLFLTSAVKPEVTINALQIANSQVVLGSGGNRKLHVRGGLVVYDPAWLYLTDTLSSGIDTLFLYGDYFHTMAGIRGGGPDSTTIVFCGKGTQNYMGTSEILSGYINYQVNPGSHLLIAEWNTAGQGSLGDFTLMAGATLSYSDYQGIYPAGQDTGVIRNLGARNFSQGANYRLYGISTGPYVTGPGIPDTVNQLIVESSMDQAYLSKDVAVMDSLKLLGNTLRFDGKRLSLFGPVYRTAGNLMGDSTSQLALMGGSTSFLTLPSMLRDLGTLTINRPAVMIMSDTMRIHDRLELVRGTFNNGGRSLLLQNGVAIYRNSVSSLAGTGPIVFANQAGLEYGTGTTTAGPEMPASASAIMYLALKGSGDTLIVNRDTLNVWNSLSVAGGIRFNGKSFSSYGLIDTVGPSGELVFTDSCRANIFGSIDTTFLPGITGGTLTIDNMYGSVMRRNIDAFGPLTLTIGGLTVGSNTLMLGDSLTGSGLLTTDSTSSLVFYGQPVSQTMPSTLNQLSKLSWGRTVPLYITTPLVLHDTLMLVQGVIDNSTNLTLRSGATVVRNSGVLMMPASNEGPVNLVYGSHGGGTLATGSEIPGNASDLYHLTVGLNTQPGDTILLSSDAQVNGRLSLYQGAFNVGANGLTLLDTIDILAGKLLADSTSSIKILNSPYMVRLPLTIKELDSLVLSSFSGLELADTVHVRSGYRQTTGRISYGQLIYGPSATLIYDNLGADTTSNFEFPDIGGPYNLTAAAGWLQLHTDRTVPGILTLNGPLLTGTNTVTVDTFGGVIQGAGFVEGNLAKLIPVTVNTTVAYELGTISTGVSAVDVQVFNNTTPAFVTAGVKMGTFPLVNDSTACLRKFWTFSGAGLAADSNQVLLSYLPSDFNTGFSEAADESTMVAGRYDNGATPGWQFPVIVNRNIFGNSDGGSIVLSHTGNFAENPEFTLGRDSMSIFNPATDTMLPYITSSLPLDGAAGVGLTDSVQITFSEPVRKSGVSYTFVPNPGLVDTVWSADSTTIIFNHSAFANLTSYTVRVLGVQDTAGNVLAGRDSIGFATMAAADTTPPAVTLVSPSSGAAGVLLQQQVVVNFSEPMDTTSFRFRCTPDPLYWSLSWSSGDSQVTMSHGDFAPGTLYSFRVDSAADKSGNPMLNPPFQWSFTAVLPDSMVFNLAGGAYRMFSVPLSPVDSTPAQILGDELGAYSDSTWRIFGYKPASGYVERPNISSGYGYWLATAGNAQVEVKGTRFMNFFNQPIDSGWNLIGNPFDTTVTLANVIVLWNDTIGHFVNFTDSTVNSVVRQRMYNWRDASPDFENNGVWDSLTPYNAGDQMHPWTGYALYAVRPCTLMMERFMGKGPVEAVKAPQYQIDWQLTMDVVSGNAVDRGLKLGVSPQAREAYDRLDAEKPPLISSNVKAFFLHQDWNQGPCQDYQNDFRPAADYIEWPLVIEAAKADQLVVLNTQITGEPGNGGYLYLLDRKKGNTFDLKTQKSIGFSGSQELAVVYSSSPFDGRNLTPLIFGLGRIGPNPFIQRMTINYQLPQAGLVSLAVYNITGQRVRTLTSQNLPPGYYSQVWDGRSDGGRTLSAGVYIVRLSSSGRSAAQKIVKLQ